VGGANFTLWAWLVAHWRGYAQTAIRSIEITQFQFLLFLYQMKKIKVMHFINGIV
jgi:hypothetical protein